MHYFYSKKTGEYVGGSTEKGACPEGCGVTEAAPVGACRFFNGEAWVEKKTRRSKAGKVTDADVAKIASYTQRQCLGALIRAKGEKRELIKARLDEIRANA